MRLTSRRLTVRAAAALLVLAAGAISSSAMAFDEKTIHGSACEPGTIDGATGDAYFNGLAVEPGTAGLDAVCPLTRDNVTNAITDVWVRVDPGSDAVDCTVYSLSSQGLLGGIDGATGGSTSGSSPQSIDLDGLDSLSNFTNGTYVVICGSDDAFTLLGVKYRED